MDDGVEKQLMFVRDIEYVCKVPLWLHEMRKDERQRRNKSYLVQLICLSCTFEVIPKSLGKRLHKDLDRIETIFFGAFIIIWM